MTIKDQNPQNIEIVEPQNEDVAMETTNQILSDEQMNNLLSKLDNHFVFEGNVIFDRYNKISFVVEDAKEKVIIKDPNNDSNSFKVEKRLLESDEFKPKKGRKLANKITQLVTHSITNARKSEQIQADIESITGAIKSKFTNLGKFQAVEHVDDNKFVARYESGNAYIEKDDHSGEFTIISVHQIKNETLNVK